MGKRKRDSGKSESEVKTRGYKLLLFADNPRHMAIFRKVKKVYGDCFVGCWHTQYDDKGREIVTGDGKKHVHVILYLKNAVWWRSVCKRLGSISPDGLPDYQFVRAIGYDNAKETVKKGFCYLTHANAPTKEQYPCSALFGAPDLVQAAQNAILACEMGALSMSECVYHVLEWVSGQPDYISMNDFGFWICGTPYFKASSSRIVYQAISEHNQKIAAEKAKARQHLPPNQNIVKSSRFDDQLQEFERAAGWNGEYYENIVY